MKYNDYENPKAKIEFLSDESLKPYVVPDFC